MKAKRDEEKARLWAERIAGFERSKLSRRAWCRQEGLNPNTLDYWRSRLRPATKALVPIVVAEPEGASVEIALAGGTRVRVARTVEVKWLVELVRGLSAC